MSDVVHGATDAQSPLLLSRLLHATQENDGKQAPCPGAARPVCVCGLLSLWRARVDCASKADGSVGPRANIAGAVTITATYLQCIEFML